MVIIPICKNVNLKPVNTTSKISNILDSNKVYTISITHGEVTDNTNPNGSLNNIAGICNSGKNVFGMMPHPERCAS